MKRQFEDSQGMALVVVVFCTTILLTLTGASLLFSQEEARLEEMTGNSSVYYSTYGIGLALKRTFKTIGWQEMMN